LEEEHSDEYKTPMYAVNFIYRIGACCMFYYFIWNELFFGDGMNSFTLNGEWEHLIKG